MDYNKRAKELLNELGEEKFNKIFSDLWAIGMDYDIEPIDIISILMVGEEDTNN